MPPRPRWSRLAALALAALTILLLPRAPLGAQPYSDGWLRQHGTMLGRWRGDQCFVADVFPVTPEPLSFSTVSACVSAELSLLTGRSSGDGFPPPLFWRYATSSSYYADTPPDVSFFKWPEDEIVVGARIGAHGVADGLPAWNTRGQVFADGFMALVEGPPFLGPADLDGHASQVHLTGYQQIRFYRNASQRPVLIGIAAVQIDLSLRAVPEPATLALTAGVLLALAGVARRRRA
jgi:hypothetical protein